MQNSRRRINALLIGRALQNKRLERGFSLTEIAYFLDMSEDKVRDIENGTQEIYASELYRLCLLFKTNPADICRDCVTT